MVTPPQSRTPARPRKAVEQTRSLARGLVGLGVVITLLSSAACEPPPELTPGHVILKNVILRDATIFSYIHVFQIHILKDTTTSGATVTCSDFPDVFKIGDPQLQKAVEVKPIPNKWKNPPTAAVLPPIKVPTNQNMVFLVSGLTSVPKGVHQVAFGCSDQLKFTDNKPASINIDVKATTGAPCTTQSECEQTLFCRTGVTIPGGYCARVPCSGDTECPPATRCVTDETAGTGMCARVCTSVMDCNTGSQTQDCVGRMGPTSNGCAKVCVYPLWSSNKSCTAP